MTTRWAGRHVRVHFIAGFSMHTRAPPPPQCAQCCCPPWVWPHPPAFFFLSFFRWIPWMRSWLRLDRWRRQQLLQSLPERQPSRGMSGWRKQTLRLTSWRSVVSDASGVCGTAGGDATSVAAGNALVQLMAAAVASLLGPWCLVCSNAWRLPACFAGTAAGPAECQPGGRRCGCLWLRKRQRCLQDSGGRGRCGRGSRRRWLRLR